MMTTNTSKFTVPIDRVSRRRFLTVTAGAIAAPGAVLLPQQTIASDKPVSLEQMAHALHEAIGHYSDRHTQVFSRAKYPEINHVNSLGYAMEVLRTHSVDEIQCLLKSLFQGAS